jgi:hypothetical protein
LSDRFFTPPAELAPATAAGTPNMEEEMNYREMEAGKHVLLSHGQFDKIPNADC